MLQESESLIQMNCNLKSEVQHLELEKQKLVKILKLHETSCTKRSKELHPTGQTAFYQDNFVSLEKNRFQLYRLTQTYVNFLQVNHNYSIAINSIQANLPNCPNIFEMSSVPNISVKMTPMTGNEIFPPADPGVFFDPPSFDNFSMESENNFLGMRPFSSAYLHPYHRIQSYHSSDSQCMAL